jgi:hypothetical protein
MSAPAASVTSRLAFLNDATVRAVFYQALTFVLVAGGIWYLVSNTITNMSTRGMSAGFDFMDVSAGFNIAFTLVPKDSLDGTVLSGKGRFLFEVAQQLHTTMNRIAQPLADIASANRSRDEKDADIIRTITDQGLCK